MKRHAILSFLVAVIAVVGLAREPRRAVLIVQNHVPDPDVSIAFLALTDELTAKLSGSDLRVINPYNSVGINQNRDVRGEKMPEVSAMELARRFKAEGTITASVVEFRETPPSGAERKFTLKMILNLADAQTGGVVCGAKGEQTTEKYMAIQIHSHRATYINNLMSKVLDKCTTKLLSDPLLKNWEPTPPPNPKPRRPLSIPELTLSEMDGTMQKLIVAMRANPVFRDNYDTAQQAIDRAPLVIVGGLVDLTKGKSPTDDLDNLLGAASQNVRMTLINSRLFDAKDDALVTTITKRIIENGNSPLEDGELMAALKQHGSPDFYMVGDLSYFGGRKKHTYRFHLALHNLHTGKIVWEGTEDVEKEKEGTK